MPLADQLEDAAPSAEMVSQRDRIAPVVYAERGRDPRSARMVTHTILNRVKSGRAKEFGADLEEVINKPWAFTSVTGSPKDRVKYESALRKQFKNPAEEADYFQTRHEVEEVLRGRYDHENQGQVLYYNPSKVKTPPWDFSQIEEVPGDGDHRMFRYKRSP